MAQEPRQRFFAEDAGKDDADSVAYASADEREEELFGGEKKTDGAGAGADGFHETNFRAAFDNRGGRMRLQPEHGGQQGSERRKPEQRTDAREDAAFSFSHAANHVGVNAGQDLFYLIGDGRGVGAAGPALEIGGVHGGGIAAGEIVFRFCQRADVETAVLTGLVCELLRDLERRDDGVIFRAGGGKNSRDGQGDTSICRIDVESVAGLDVCTRGEGFADDGFGSIVMEPAAVNVPPGIGLIHSGCVTASVWKSNGVVRPGSHQRGH